MLLASVAFLATTAKLSTIQTQSSTNTMLSDLSTIQTQSSTNTRLSDLNSSTRGFGSNTSHPDVFDSSPRLTCPKGKYIDDSGKCLLCQAGSYTSFDGSSSCNQCAPGKYTDEAIPNCDQESCIAEENSTKTFLLFDETVSWYDARTSCEDDGGRLATVQSLSSNNFVTSIFSSNSNVFGIWIGYRFCESRGEWIWSDGSTNNYTNWDYCSPHVPEVETCAAIQGGDPRNPFSPRGSWMNIDCNSSSLFGFICEYDGTGATACLSCMYGKYSNVTGASGVCEACPGGQYSTHVGATVCSLCAAGKYLMMQSTPWTLQIVTTPATWYDAEQSCVMKGGRLASIDSEAESEYLSSLLNSSNDDVAMWIGYAYNVSSGSWTWADGSQSGYTNWNSSDGGLLDRFDSNSSKEDLRVNSSRRDPQKDSCAAALVETGSWTKDDCSLSYSYVCEFDPCESCSPGTYSSQQGSSVCDDCPAGTYIIGIGARSAINCTECPSGSYSDDGASGCTPCAAGSWRRYNASEANCTECDAGSFSTIVGASDSSACKVCESGSYSSAGSDYCSPCAAGWWQSEIGTSSCISCDAGSFSTTIGASEESVCQACGSGTYSGIGSSICVQCGAFSWQNESG